MNLRDEWRERVAEALDVMLSEHAAARGAFDATCGTCVKGRDEALHLADALLAPGGVVAGIVAEAWDEGYRAAYEFERGVFYPEKTNPYRTEEGTISTPVRRSEPLSGSGEGAGTSDGAEDVERGEG